jgi:hypothetical protein
MTKEQRESLDRLGAKAWGDKYEGEERGTYNTEDVIALLSLIDKEEPAEESK